MAHITETRVGESTITVGTGDFALGGALTSHVTHSTVMSIGDTCFYDCAAVDANGAETGDWEEGLGTYASGNNLTRTTILRSSNANSAVSFSAGTKYVRIVAERRQVAAVPRGGSTSYGLTKASGTDYDTQWSAVAALSNNTFTAAQRGAIVTLTDAATVALDLSLANQYALTLGGSRTLGVPTNIVAGQQGTISVRQDATGSRTLAYAWPYEWFGGTAGVLSTAGCTRDLLGYSVDFYTSSTVTITIATPGVITMTGHGMVTGQKFQLATTGALPTGLSTGTTYFASVVDANTIKACSSLVNAAAGTFIATSGTQSGTHTLTACSITLNLSKAAA